MEKGDKNYGKAYAFFDCKYSKSQIKAAVPQICEIESPSGLELSLMENPEAIRGDREMAEALETAKRIDLSKIPADQREGGTISYKYVLQAKLPKKTNNDAAKRLVSIMNGAYMSTHLWEYGENFFGRTIYKSGGDYVAAER